MFAITPEVLNDDRIGRALDALAPELLGVVGSIGVQAITEFGVDVGRIHWDMTSISLYGAYTSPDHDYIEPRRIPSERSFPLFRLVSTSQKFESFREGLLIG